MISEFSKKVMLLIHQIPKGKVATYKQVAELAGKPQGSRGVAWILHSSSTAYKLPWHRVINSSGRISFERLSHNFREQRKRLRAEGVVISDDGQTSLAKFQWKKRASKKRGDSSRPRMFR